MSDVATRLSSSPLPVVAPASVSLRGVMKKKGHSLFGSGFKVREFVLEGQAIQYFVEGKMSGTPKGVISIIRTTTVDCSIDVVNPAPTKNLDFKVSGVVG